VAAGTDDAIDHGAGAHQIMDEEEQRGVHVRGQLCCRCVADDDVNVVPPVLCHAATGVSGHGLAQIDAGDVPGRTDSCYEVGKVRPGTTANVEHVVAGPQPEVADHAWAPAVGEAHSSLVGRRQLGVAARCLHRIRPVGHSCPS
jgi:hypothetical protein